MRNLLAISIGPVQDFIAAARRTRDLWFGSYVLSEISKAAAATIAPSCLIFPNGAAAADPDAHVANVILVLLPEGQSPKTASENAEKAARARWLEFAREAFQTAHGYILHDRAKRQTGDVIEFYWASSPLPSDAEYRKTRQRVMRLLAGRKRCRDFQPWMGERAPKSSLDGGRETVLRELKDGDEIRARNDKLRLNGNEQLDAVGLVKRLAMGRQQYPSVSRVAADPWLRGIAGDAKPTARLLAECGKIPETVLTRINQKRFPQYAAFPFEGTAVYRTRHREFWKDTGRAKDEFTQLADAVKALEGHYGAPDPYLAILAADGDAMGKVISGIDRAGSHVDFSADLGRFAGEAADIVAKHYGCLVYSGGDDVLAFLPLDQCLECARELHDRFGSLLAPYRTPEADPTLSVGIAIGHSMEPLEDLRGYARAAETAAKGKDRDGLAVHLHTRGGAPVLAHASWKESLDTELSALARMHLAEQIPDKAGYDLRELARLYHGWPEEEAIRADMTRLLKRKRIREPEKSWGEQLAKVTDYASLRLLADKIILARKLATAKRQALPRTPSVKEEAA